MNDFDRARFPNLNHVMDALLQTWPEHAGFISKSFPVDNDGEMFHAEQLAAMLDRLAGDRLADVMSDYKWTCAQLLEEELHFRRTNSYRLSSFAEASREVYDNAGFMARYVNGLLLSHLFWANHRRVLKFYADRFLPALPDDYRHLEIGPGHGLYLALAALDPRNAEAVGWEVSETSARQTEHCLHRLGIESGVRIDIRDVMSESENGPLFDSVVISEVLEHLEEPARALSRLKNVMAPDGVLFVNMPVNSPAPDHIFLLREPEEVEDLVREAGFRIEDSMNYPATGYTEKRARKHAATISCVVIATPRH